MDTLRPYFNQGREYLDAGIKVSEQMFNHYIEYVDFPLFCVLYSLFMLWLLRKLNRPTSFRPQNQELVSNFVTIQHGKKQ
jgi:hypothetical protein